MSDTLKAPFPWFGGKSRAAPEIWERLGDVANYVEPFAGSLAVPLARPHAPKIETVNDIDGMLCNFWRTMVAIGQGDERALADICTVADWPVNETDLHARHKHLVARIPEVRAMLDADPGAFDATLAGYWVWGICAWIGSGWCTENPREYQANKGKRARSVVTAEVARASAMVSTPPRCASPSRRLPMLGGSGSEERGNAHPGRGVHSMGARVQLPRFGGNSTPDAGGELTGIHGMTSRSRLPEVLAALGQRLRYVRVACGDWRRVLTDSVTWRHGTTGIMLDPPYTHDGRATGLYSGGDSKDIAADVEAWAVEHGADKRLLICLCRYDDGSPVPDGWTERAWKAKGGYGGQSDGENVNAHRERLWFSPGCIRARQVSMFGAL